MTKKEFKEAMLRGLGRCVVAVRQEPEKYRDIVLWACTRNIAYDAQCEGTRSWYVYTMASSYPDKETFIDAAAEALKKYRPNSGWDLLHLSELLMLFAQDGSQVAKQAVEEKYQEVFAGMLARKRRPNRIFHELSDLEQLGLILAVDRDSVLRICKDFGRLYREKSYMLDGDFTWFYDSKGCKYKATMENAARKNKDIACFMQREQACINAREELRAEALNTFSSCLYPDDPNPIIEDTQSSCEKLRNAAWRALENIRHTAVRQFALHNADEGIRTPENFALLAINYLPKDEGLMEGLLRELIAQKDWDGVHWAGMDIYRAFYKDSGIPHPKHLLPLLYAYTPCSCCRESAIRYMSSHRLLTKEMLEESLFDSNDDIRKYAEKRLKKSLFLFE